MSEVTDITCDEALGERELGAVNAGLGLSQLALGTVSAVVPGLAQIAGVFGAPSVLQQGACTAPPAGQALPFVE